MSRASSDEKTVKRAGFVPGMLRTLRGRLLVQTMLPVGLIVVAFAIFAQIGYTQVTESLAKARDGDLAAIEAARVGDYLLGSVQALSQVVDSPELLEGKSTRIYYLLLSAPLLQHFDITQVTDAGGRVVAASDATTGGSVFSRDAFESLQQSGLPIRITATTLKDGRPAILMSARYLNDSGSFAGVVEGAVYFGSRKLGLPLSDATSLEASNGGGSTEGAKSYLVASDGTILWHTDANQVGQQTKVPPLINGPVSQAGAIITKVDGEQSVIGYAPLNLGRLIPRARIDPQWVQWNVVTEEKWANLVAPLNSLLYGLLALAFIMFLVSLVLVARSANTLTRPVAKLVAAARALSAGRLKQRLEVSGPVEIEELSHQFNTMADRLAASYAGLEAKVADRTRELAAANAGLERSLMESQSVQRVAANIAGTVGLDEILQLIASSASEALNSQGAMVFLPDPSDPNKLNVASLWNLPFVQPGISIPADHSLNGTAIATGQPQVSYAATSDDRVFKSLPGADDIHSILAVPLVSHGHITGSISAINKLAGRFTENDVALLKLLADQTAVAIERAQLYAGTERQLNTLRTINDLALSVTLSRDIEETLKGGMERIVKLLDASGAIVFLFNEKTRTLDLTVSHNLAPRHLDLLMKTASSVPIDKSPPYRVAMLEAFLRQEPYKVEDMASLDYMNDWWNDYASRLTEVVDRTAEVKVGALIALPVSVRDKRLGALTIYFPEPRKFSPDDVQMYQSFAQILGLAVYNTQLLAQSSKLATVEERARLARELHDSVTQSLFSLNLTLRAARRVLLNDPQAAMKLLDNVHELAQGSLAEMRALIFELRPQALENEGLALALQKHADAVRARSGLDVHLSVRGERRLPIDHEEALYQIAREALHNVVKHAQATEAWITLDMSEDDVSLSVRDNGRGFDQASIVTGGGSHIGTSTMQERANAIGGMLTMESKKGEGTEVSVKVHIPQATTTVDNESQQETSDFQKVNSATA